MDTARDLKTPRLARLLRFGEAVEQLLRDHMKTANRRNAAMNALVFESQVKELYQHFLEA